MINVLDENFNDFDENSYHRTHRDHADPLRPINHRPAPPLRERNANLPYIKTASNITTHSLETKQVEPVATETSQQMDELTFLLQMLDLNNDDSNEENEDTDLFAELDLENNAFKTAACDNLTPQFFRGMEDRQRLGKHKMDPNYQLAIDENPRPLKKSRTAENVKEYVGLAKRLQENDDNPRAHKKFRQ